MNRRSFNFPLLGCHFHINPRGGPHHEDSLIFNPQKGCSRKHLFWFLSCSFILIGIISAIPTRYQPEEFYLKSFQPHPVNYIPMIVHSRGCCFPSTRRDETLPILQQNERKHARSRQIAAFPLHLLHRDAASKLISGALPPRSDMRQFRGFRIDEFGCYSPVQRIRNSLQNIHAIDRAFMQTTKPSNTSPPHSWSVARRKKKSF